MAQLHVPPIDRHTGPYLVPPPPRTNRLFSRYLFSYKLKPQTVVLFGYSDNFLGLAGIDLRQSDRTFLLKVG